LVPRGSDERLGPKIVNFIRFNLLNEPNHTRKIGKIPIDDLDLINNAKPAQTTVLKPAGAGPASHSVYFVPLFEEKLRKIGAVLTGYASNKCTGQDDL